MYAFLRKHNISWSDATHSAWQQMFGLTNYRVTELFVVLKDGSGLLSRLPGRFEGLPNGPLHWVITAMSFFMSRIEVRQIAMSG